MLEMPAMLFGYTRVLLMLPLRIVRLAAHAI